MCGIIGVVGNENSLKLVTKGLNLLSHRGLDGNNILNVKNGFVGHCLHAIVNKIKQPFVGRGIFLVNCEIYNWKEFDLQAKNDAELFFKLIENVGVEETLKLIDGDYSGAYFKDDKIYLFKDLFGVKPLWYSLENGFSFASEKKVLEEFGLEIIHDLNPRQILVYDTTNKEVNFVEREFVRLEPLLNENYSEIKKKTSGLLINAIAKRIPDCKFGLLFSGGVDSVFLALILKKLDVDFTCYTCVVDYFGFKEPEDLSYSKKIASDLGLDFKVVKVSLEDVEKTLNILPKVIESNNVTKVSVALPFYFASKQATKDGCKVLFSGLGSEEIFAGYERHKRSLDINKECYSGLLWLYERDLYRDDLATMINNVELRVPFLDKALVDYCLRVPSKFKLSENQNKLLLRDIAFEFGLDKEFAYRKKKAAQYGGNFEKTIDKLARLNKIKNKSEYLRQFYDKGNLQLGVLFSSGKDSCYAMYIMHKQNYDIKCLISLKSKNKDSFMFHTPNIDLVKYQAEALGIPLILKETSGEKENELKDLKEVLLEAKNKNNIQGVITGALYSTYQRDRIEKICNSIGLKVFSPLWHKDQLLELKELLINNFEIILSSVAADGFNEKWLGRKLDAKMIEDLVKLNLKNKINVAGEGGEFESLVLDMPMFKKIIKIKEADVVMTSEHVGKYVVNKVELFEKNL